MTRALLDTNVVLDFLLDRPPFAEAAAAIWEALVQKRFEGYVAAITPINLFYIARKLKGTEMARASVAGLIRDCQICPLDRTTLQTALALPLKDYEDAAQLASALASGLDIIVTRDPADFAGASLAVLSPVEFLAKIATE
jgi:predicted nucleic acid-binding protein